MNSSTTVLSTSQSYDGYGRLSSVSSTAAGSPVTSRVYTYDSLSRRNKATTEAGYSWRYTYNDRGELIDAYKDAWDNTVPYDRLKGTTTKYDYDHIIPFGLCS